MTENDANIVRTTLKLDRELDLAIEQALLDRRRENKKITKQELIGAALRVYFGLAPQSTPELGDTRQDIPFELPATSATETKKGER